MHLRNLEGVREIFTPLKGSVIGAGITCFSRISPSYFLHDYRIVAVRKTGDLPFLRRSAEVFCLEEETGTHNREVGINAAWLLAHPLVEGYLKRRTGPKYILPYQSYSDLESIARREGWLLLANPASLRERVGERGFFQRLIDRLGLRSVPGGIHPFGELFKRSYTDWAASLGNRLVIQLPEVVSGGGRGTFFVFSPQEYERTLGFLKNRLWRGVELKSASVKKFIEGIPASVALCVTRHGVLLSGVQRQLIDLPYCRNLLQRGVFCGHSWGGESWSPALAKDTFRQALEIGRFLGGQGYLGIAGIDFLLDLSRERAFPIEINPRFTGAFPFLSMLHVKNGLIPLEAFHILEFLGIPYDIDLDQLNEQYAGPLRGGHIILFLLSEKNGVRPNPPEAGLYRAFPGETFSFEGVSAGFQNMLEEDQFMLVDGPPIMEGERTFSDDPFYRIGRLLFPHPITGPGGGLSLKVEQIVRWAHHKITGNVPGL